MVRNNKGTLSTHRLCQHTSLPTDGANCKDTIRNEPNSVGFAREKAQTMSFVERGIERLGLGHQVVGFSWRSYKVK